MPEMLTHLNYNDVSLRTCNKTNVKTLFGYLLLFF